MKLILQIAIGIVLAGVIGTVLSVACVALFVGGATKALNDVASSIDKTQCALRPTEIAKRPAVVPGAATALASDDATVLARC